MVTEDFAKQVLSTTKRLQESIGRIAKPPAEITAPIDQPVLPNSLFRGTRGYIEKVVHQINRSYSSTCFDACAVMIRRLIETLIIEAFEHHGRSNRIQDANGDYFYLERLISVTLSETKWNLGRNTKSALQKLKKIGDLSAHSRRYNAHRQYIDDIIIDLRTASEELLYIAGLRS